MNRKYLPLVATGVAMAFAAGAAQAASNQLANGGFETVGGVSPYGPATNWIGSAAGYSVDTTPADANSGNNSLLLASPALNSAIAEQNTVKDGGSPNLTAGDDYLLTFWAKGFAGTTGNVLFQLQYLDSIGNIKADSHNQFFQSAINPSTYTKFTYDLGAVPVGATAALLQFVQGIGPIGDNGQCPGPNCQTFLPGTVNIDDVSLVDQTQAVPLPASAWLLLGGLGGLGAIARRRKA